MNKLSLIFVLFFAVLSYAASTNTYWPLKIGKQLYMRIELALTPQQIQKGLMHRTSMPQDAGMLFVFNNEHIMEFWMKNTLIPLDILFLNAKGEIVAIHRMEVERPMRNGENISLYDMTLTTYSSIKPAQYAIELNAGQVQKAGIKVGDIINLRTEALQQLLKE